MSSLTETLIAVAATMFILRELRTMFLGNVAVGKDDCPR